jgi:hypothetical protein
MLHRTRNGRLGCAKSKRGRDLVENTISHLNSQRPKVIVGTYRMPEIHVLDPGHFVLDTGADEIAVLVKTLPAMRPRLLWNGQDAP